MSIIAVLIPVTLVLVAFGIWAFFWAVRTGQFEELDVPGWEILLEERAAAEAGLPPLGLAEPGSPLAGAPLAGAPGSGWPVGSPSDLPP